MSGDRLRELLARYVERHVLRGERPDPTELCRDCPELLDDLRASVREYEALSDTLAGGYAPPDPTTAPEPDGLPQFAGFRTIERIATGGSGTVYKLQDLELGRFVAAKVIRPDNPVRTTLDDFLREARSLALFADPRIVTLLEFRGTADPPVLLTEYVEGFELGRIGRSLEYAQRARVMTEVAEAIHHAHTLGIQHRDLKPGNVMLDAKLSPKILDFGLSRGDADRGHGKGTLAYMAPEQLDPGQPIDARADVDALGVILYELLCGQVPFEGRSVGDCIAAIRAGAPCLPVEIEPGVPERLQAIALKAMEREPADRYASARELALELRRFAEGKPVLARPTLYQTALSRRIGPHLEQVREWLRIRLIHEHEAGRLSDAYRDLEIQDDDWIVRGRSLSFSQISLYLGALLLLAGSLLYYAAYSFEAVRGVLPPLVVLGLPFAGLNLAARWLYRSERPAVAVAFYVGAALLLPLFLLIAFQESGLWLADPERPLELFGGAFASNRQLQLATFVACAWAGWLAVTTRTVTLSSCFTVLLVALGSWVLGDLGLLPWIENGEWHVLAVHLFPVGAALAALGLWTERRRLPWLARPLDLAAATILMLALELLALNGRLLGYLGVTLAPFQPAGVTNPQLIDTLAAMNLNGLALYTVAHLLERHGSPVWVGTARLMYVVSPFAVLQPVAWLSAAGEYSRRYDWLYLLLALSITVLSRFRQRKSFYYAGLLNIAGALWYLTSHYEWFDRPVWAVTVVVSGLAALGLGFALHQRERRAG